MKVSRSKRSKLGALGFAAVVITAGSAYAASNTVVNRNAGQGAGTVAGFTVTNIGYVADDDYVAAVTFNIVRDLTTTTVDSANAAVSVGLDDSGMYYPCTVAGGVATCTVTDTVSFAEVTSVAVLAYDLLDTAS
jgi:hypothetical protein